MPGKIRRLSEDMIGRIAAGEVVERPAAAIKEMVENSLDAGATAVTVEIRDGGITYMRVTDNGSGIAQSEIRMAFERHATSKIHAPEDLSAIATLGFRGEALASIAAVSRVTLTTRTAEDASGVRVTNEGGVITAIEEAACPGGTAIVVRDLFYNTPVRLKFLKKPATEAAQVADVLMRMILSRPDVSFRLLSQGKTVYHSAGDGQLSSAVFSIYGSEMHKTMRFVEGHGGGLVLSGYVGIGESGRGSRTNQSFFINGRYMHSSLLSGAVEEACRERVMIGKYPTCVLHLTMPYETVDVNVHPNKLEVRFQNEAAVAEAVTAIIREGIRDRDALEHPVVLELTPDAPAAPAEVTKTREAVPVQAVLEKVRPAAVAKSAAVPAAQPVPAAPVEEVHERAPIPVAPVLREPAAVYRAEPAPLPPAEPVSFLPEAPRPMRLIGSVFNTYILVEYEDHLLMIDQHAAHERLNYERMMKEYGTAHAGQELLVPEIVSVTRREQQVLEENRALLEGIGFAVEPFGEAEVSVRSVPMILGEPQAAGFLHEALDQLMNEGRGWTEERRRSAILQTACKHAVKGGETLTEEDMRYLVSRIVDDKVTPTCPHGRPLVVALSHAELDKRFKRIQ